MSVSGTMAVSQATMLGGRSGINAQRGTKTWGANYIYNSGGIQEDILTVSDVLANLSSSGGYATDAEVLAASGAAVITASGGAVTVSAAAILAASGAITSSGTFDTPTVTGDVLFSASGSSSIGSVASPIIASGIFMKAVGGTTVQIVAYANGMVSGVAT